MFLVFLLSCISMMENNTIGLRGKRYDHDRVQWCAVRGGRWGRASYTIKARCTPVWYKIRTTVTRILHFPGQLGYHLIARRHAIRFLASASPATDFTSPHVPDREGVSYASVTEWEQISAEGLHQCNPYIQYTSECGTSGSTESKRIHRNCITVVLETGTV